LDFFGARYFSGAQGRFTSPDPLMIHPDRLAEPQWLNRYVYARNNPLKYIDPNGLDDITYDQAGKEIERKKRSKWHNFFVGDTWKTNWITNRPL
jgi:RHS repeat-associated protein